MSTYPRYLRFLPAVIVAGAMGAAGSRVTVGSFGLPSAVGLSTGPGATGRRKRPKARTRGNLGRRKVATWKAGGQARCR